MWQGNPHTHQSPTNIANNMASKIPIKLIDTIEMAELIYARLNTFTLPKIFYKDSKRWNNQMRNDSLSPSMSEIIERMNAETMEIEKKHRLSYSFKSHAYDFDKIYMTCGRNYIEINDEDYFVYIEPNDEEKINRIRFARVGYEKDDITQMTSIADLLADVEYFINNVRAYIHAIAGNYAENHKEISLQKAMSSTLAALGITGERQEPWVQANAIGCYRHFRDYQLVNSPEHDTTTKIYLMDFDLSDFQF